MAANPENSSDITTWRWGLRENPFDDVEAPNYPRQIIGEAGLQDFLTRVHNDFDQGRITPRIIALIGRPGIGKTHFLKFWRTQIHDGTKGIVVYLSKPYLSPSSNLFRPTAEAILRTEHGVSKSELIEWLTTIYSQDNLRQEFEAHLPYTQRTSDLGLQAAFKLLLDSNLRLQNAAWKWIAGIRLLSDERLLLREHGISVLQDSHNAAAETPNKAVSLILSIAKIVHLATNRPFYLLIDEIESLRNLGSIVRVKAYLENIRMLRQGAGTLTAAFCIILACTPEAWALIERQDRMLAERVTKILLLEGPQTKQDVKDFITLRMTVARETLPPEAQHNDIYPFKSTDLNELYAFVEAHPAMRSWRIVIDLSRRILDAYAMNPNTSVHTVLESAEQDLAHRLALKKQNDPEENALNSIRVLNQLKLIREGVNAIGRGIDRVNQRVVALKPYILNPKQPLSSGTTDAKTDPIRNKLFALSPYFYSIITFQRQTHQIASIGDGYRSKGQIEVAVTHYLQAGRIADAATKACERPRFWVLATQMAIQSLSEGYFPALMLAATSTQYQNAVTGFTSIQKNIATKFIHQLSLGSLQQHFFQVQSQYLSPIFTHIEKACTQLDAYFSTQTTRTLNASQILETNSQIETYQEKLTEVIAYLKNIHKNITQKVFQPNRAILESFNQFGQLQSPRQNTIYALLDTLQSTPEAISPIIELLQTQTASYTQLSDAVTPLLDLKVPRIQKTWNALTPLITHPSTASPGIDECYSFLRAVLLYYQDVLSSEQAPSVKATAWAVLEVLFSLTEHIWLDLAENLPPELDLI